MKIILLSGGSGQLLLPLSNGAQAKQFLRLLKSPDGEKESMVQRVVRQIKEAGLLESITVATSAAQADMISNQLSEYGVDIVTEPAVLELPAHASPIQLRFYDGAAFPAGYRGDAFVTLHGSWNRDPPNGYAVARLRFDDVGRPEGYEEFLTGFYFDGNRVFGRPAGLAVLPDGALLVGDDFNGVIYRVAYAGAG